MIAKKGIHYALKMLLIAGFPVVLGGCWDIKDINHRALPIAMGLESHDGGYKISFLLPKTTQGRTDVRIVTDTGDTINSVIDRIGKNLEMQVDLLHLKVIVFDRGFAEQGLRDSISSFMRARDVSPKAIVAITEGKMETLFQKLKSSSTTSGMEIYDYFEKSAGWTPQVAQTRIWEVFRSLNSYTRDVVIPIVEAGQTTAIASTGSAVIKNAKMVDRITPDETLLFNVYHGLSSQGKIEVMAHASVLIVADKLTHRSSFEGNKPVLNSRMTLNVTVQETKGSPTVTMIKQELDELLARRLQRMFRKVQSKEADILGLGQFFRSKIPRDRLEHWRSDYYPHMELNLKVDSIIQNEGLLKMKQ
ncbi:Ger(x)C family spore germination protein [Paenibacillus hamazuiensis]|uniref:Ger(x)C family spore germination protein n=1 Tax=Paenibacillus hamazuiensis TaxID=2936508 RepID=UPI00200D0CDD|nr:Ger(x)C family spore germination protein [Paenibacillus hamazuiensis]